ncbi:hypothetical protein [Sodalis-like endosymbiont of Proechinophthirus fluctus]|uniref:hypothetical protein n=1 Tax=Sodalis-like endosymbiont of Proechinophthirus fluctus TaxID=1462730 RepID=UPI00082DE38C|nr:hypothetical protein [Sodalis-like endosymbiont of Proechinophthirus fluctus]
MTIYASKGHQEEYVIIVGINDGGDGFPAPARELIIEQVLLPQPEDYLNAEERRLLLRGAYPLQRAGLPAKANSSVFIEELLSRDSAGEKT